MKIFRFDNKYVLIQNHKSKDTQSEINNILSSTPWFYMKQATLIGDSRDDKIK